MALTNLADSWRSQLPDEGICPCGRRVYGYLADSVGRYVWVPVHVDDNTYASLHWDNDLTAFHADGWGAVVA